LWIVGSSPTMTNGRAIFILHGAAGNRHERLLCLPADFELPEAGTFRKGECKCLEKLARGSPD
jgi:hypothetical protein